MKLIVCGSIAIDRIMHFSGTFQEVINPDKLAILSVGVLLDGLQESRGGVGANIAFATAQLGDQPTLLGAVGEDGRSYLEALTAAGVVTDHIYISELQTASFSVFTDAVNNQIGGFYPGAMADSGSLNFSLWPAEDIFVCVTAHDPDAMRAQVAECQQRGIRLMYDPSQQVANLSADDLHAGVAAAEILSVNEYEYDLLCKKLESSPDDLAASVDYLIVTKGAQGSVIMGVKLAKPIVIPAVQPTVVLDPSGAGDSYRAGFLYGHLRQWKVETCAKLAATVASFVVEQQGSLSNLSVPNIIERYQQTFNQKLIF